MTSRLRTFSAAAVCALLILSINGSAAPNARRMKSSALQPAGLRTVNVSASEDFQAALNQAKPGDVIEIEAGAELIGNFVLPNKAGDNWITIRSSASDDRLPPEGTRTAPSYSNAMPKLISPNTEPALRTEPGAHHFRLIGIEITIASNVMLNFGIVRLGEGNETDQSLLPHDILIERCYIHGHPVADVSRAVALNSAATNIVDCYIADIHGIGFDTQAICGWNGPGPFKIINNYLEAAGENILFGGADPKITNLVPSDIEFRRNDCSKPLSWKDGILARPLNLNFGALRSPASNLTPGATYYYKIASRGRAGYSSIATSPASNEIAVTLIGDQNTISAVWDATDYATEYRIYRTSDAPDAPARNWIYYIAHEPAFTDTGNGAISASDSTPPTAGTRWSVKNILELKNARRVLIEGNLFENNWVDAQSGFAILFTVRNQDGKAPWSVAEDVTFVNNIIRHAAAGINILGRDDLHPSDKARRISIKNNLFYDIGGNQWGGNGRFLQITETEDVSVSHNTVIHTSNIITAYGMPNINFTFNNNLAPNNAFGVIGDGAASGNTTLDKYMPLCAFKKNAIVNGRAALYPKKNFFPASLDEVGFVDPAAANFRLAPASPFKRAGTKDKDIGADIDAIEEARKK